MQDFPVVKPHMDLLSDGSKKHKDAMLASPIESIAVGGKLLSEWTTPLDASVFSYGRKEVAAPAKKAGKALTIASKPLLAAPSKSAAATPAATAAKGLPELEPDKIKGVWRAWDAKVLVKVRILELAQQQALDSKTKEHYDEMGSVLESFSDLIDFIESAGYSKYLLGDKVSSGPPPPPIPCDCTKFGFCFCCVCVQHFADAASEKTRPAVGATNMVKCQTALLALAHVLKKATPDKNAKTSLESVRKAVDELLRRCSVFGACRAALSNALTLQQTSQPAGQVAAAGMSSRPKEPLAKSDQVTKAAAAGMPAAATGKPSAKSKRELATIEAKSKLAVKRAKKAKADARFIKGTDSEESSEDDAEAAVEELPTMQARNSAAAARAAVPEQNLDESESEDEEVRAPD